MIPVAFMFPLKSSSCVTKTKKAPGVPNSASPRPAERYTSNCQRISDIRTIIYIHADISHLYQIFHVMRTIVTNLIKFDIIESSMYLYLSTCPQIVPGGAMVVP